jgi:class 3 adenylate cyclase/predicted ATPase
VNIADWLEGLGLGQYATAFAENEIDREILPSLTSDDLREIGVVAIGHRRRLLDAIAALDAAPPPPPAEATTVAAPTTAERRQLTVMFCDLVGSTPLATRFDPEDLREIVGAYHHVVTETVARSAGFVAKYMGDGILVYFGYPEAHEDDAERAVRAGLAVIDAVAGLDLPERLQVRLGIATGLVVVGDLIGQGSAQEQSVVGETPNLAARLQGLAAPGTLIVADTTHRQLGGLFQFEDLGSQSLAGFAEPQHVWLVSGESGIASRFEALRSPATRLVGRDEELELLCRRWQQARLGEGRVVLISGEPGIGKSRLTAALQERLVDETHVRLHYFCSPHDQDSALHPVIGHLDRAAGLTRDDEHEAKLDKLEALLGPAAEIDDISLFAELLSLPGGDRFPPLDLSPLRKKERTLAALVRQLEGLARQQPVLMIFEDLHWIDPTSRELLDLVLARIDRLQVLLVATFRPEFQAPWVGYPQVTVMSLNRLARSDGAAMVQHLAGNVTLLPRDLITEIVERTDGVPLFVEEMTKAVLEADAERLRETAASMPAATLGVPATLQASLMARLDRLGPMAKRVAQIGAAIGREFSYELAAAVGEFAEAEFQEALQRLVDAGLVFQRGMPPTAEYMFKHALVQDAAYGTLLRGPRRQLHARIVKALEIHSPEVLDSQPELLAQHYSGAGLVEESVDYWGRAGRRSAARSAMAEAASQFNKGLDQLELLPETPERQRQELELQCSVGAVLNALKGYAAPETGLAYARAQELWEKLGSPTEYLHLPYARSFHHVARTEFDLAQGFDDNLLRLVRRRNDPVGQVLGNHSAGRTLFFRGRFASSRSHQEEALALYDPIYQRSLVDQTGFDPRVGVLNYLALALFCLGFPDQALARSDAAVAEARKLAHPHSLAVSQNLGARLLTLIGDDAVCGEWLDDLLAVATEQGFPQYGSAGTIFRGWVKSKNGDVVGGISLIHSGLEGFRATGAKLWMPHYYVLLAEAHEIAGQVEDALALLDEALQIIERTGERWFAAEVNRNKGELLLRQGHAEAAEESYRNALNIAQEQGAKLWELRAAASLARLRRDQGRRADACDLLAPVYFWFTEGSDTADLKEAKALLDVLS